jgi:hypothetical protein
MAATDATATDSQVPVAALRTFRDAAANAPYWATVDWQAPSTIGDVSPGPGGVVVVGTVRAAAVDPPQADSLRPYEGAPTLYHLKVFLDVDVDESRSGPFASGVIRVGIPVTSGGGDPYAMAGADAERIRAAAPLRARGVFVVQASGYVEPVAFEADDGSLVAYYASMDAAVRVHTTTSLTEQLTRHAASS